MQLEYIPIGEVGRAASATRCSYNFCKAPTRLFVMLFHISIVLEFWGFSNVDIGPLTFAGVCANLFVVCVRAYVRTARNCMVSMPFTWGVDWSTSVLGPTSPLPPYQHVTLDSGSWDDLPGCYLYWLVIIMYCLGAVVRSDEGKINKTDSYSRQKAPVHNLYQTLADGVVNSRIFCTFFHLNVSIAWIPPEW